MRFHFLFVLCLALTASIHAKGWISAEGGSSEDFRKTELSGGSDLDADGTWNLQGAATEDWSQVPGTDDWVHTGLLGAAVKYAPYDQWDLSLEGSGGEDSTYMSFGGATFSGGVHANDTWLKPSFIARGGATHYAFGPEESLRQNTGGGTLKLELGSRVTVGASADFYAYDRNLYTGGSAGTESQVTSLVPVPGSGGPLGLTPPSTQTMTTTVVTPGSAAQLDPLLPGFPTHAWSAGLSVDAGFGALLGADYTQTQIIETNIWDKVVGAFWRQDLGSSPVTLKASWNKAVEGGSYSPYFSLALTWNFNAGSAE